MFAYSPAGFYLLKQQRINRRINVHRPDGNRSRPDQSAAEESAVMLTMLMAPVLVPVAP